jgi:hypothetical protein
MLFWTAFESKAIDFKLAAIHSYSLIFADILKL